jgi:hypothetical protein
MILYGPMKIEWRKKPRFQKKVNNFSEKFSGMTKNKELILMEF